jgi:uncharacterized protein YdiU (UPF0061 family)
MSIVGLTIDYGPFGFMESYDPNYVCNGSDNEGRYRHEAQPEICGWNLLKLSQTLEPFAPRERLRAVVGEYEDLFTDEYNRLMRLKLGLGVYRDDQPQKTEPAAASAKDSAASSASASAAAAESKEEQKTVDHEELLTDLLSTMATTGSDYTNSFRALGKLVPGDDASFDATLRYLVSQCATVATRVASMASRIPEHQLRMIQHLMATKPEIFQQPGMEDQLQLIEAELARARKREQMKKQSQEDKDAADAEVWRKWLQTYDAVLQGELSEARQRWPERSVEDLVRQRTRMQNGANPKYILRNWIAQTVIDAAEKGNFAIVSECLNRLRDPYDVDDLGEEQQQQQAQAKQAAAGADVAAATAAAGPSVAAMEEEATHQKPHPSSPQRHETAKASLPPEGTQCAIHWNKEKPAWVN